jgi:hypothetical protein
LTGGGMLRELDQALAGIGTAHWKGSFNTGFEAARNERPIIKGCGISSPPGPLRLPASQDAIEPVARIARFFRS